jgi:hypothetical protein
VFFIRCETRNSLYSNRNGYLRGSGSYAQGILPNDGIKIATADKAAIRVTGNLGWLSFLISLEELVKQSGVTSAQISGLRAHYRNSWLSDIKTKILLGIM